MKKVLLAILITTTAVLAIVAIEQKQINSIRQEKIREALLPEWQAANSIIAFDHGRPYWFVDASNPSEVAWANQVRQLLLISTNDGRILKRSKLYASLGFPTPRPATSTPRVWLYKGYLFCTGPIHTEDGNEYQLTLGKHL